MAKRPSAGALVPAHLTASAAAGLSLAAVALGQDMLESLRESGAMAGCVEACGQILLAELPVKLFGALLLAGAAAGFAFVFMLPATLVLSPLALRLARRLRSKTLVVLSGAAAGVVSGLPITIFTLSLAGRAPTSLPDLLTVSVEALQSYGIAAAVAGTTFAAVLVAMR